MDFLNFEGKNIRFLRFLQLPIAKNCLQTPALNLRIGQLGHGIGPPEFGGPKKCEQF